MAQKPLSSKPAFDRASAKPAKPKMAPKPSGTDGPKPPQGAKVKMDRAQFAKERAAAKPKVAAPTPGGTTMSNSTLNVRANAAKNGTKIDAWVKKNHAQSKARLSGQQTAKQGTGMAAKQGVAKSDFAKASKSGAAKTAFSSAAKSRSAKTAFSSASKSGGKGGKSR